MRTEAYFNRYRALYTGSRAYIRYGVVMYKGLEDRI
jgi:hypothetical protein